MAISALYEHGPSQLTSMWDFQIDIDAISNYYGVIGSESFSARIKSVTLPRLGLEHELHPTGLKFYSGVTYVDTVTLEVEERFDFAILKAIEAMYDDVFNRDTNTFTAKRGPAINGILTFYAAQLGEERVVSQTFTYKNMQITDHGEIALSYEESGPMIHSISFTVDEILKGNETPRV